MRAQPHLKLKNVESLTSIGLKIPDDLKKMLTNSELSAC
jgi:hypothetical protein